VKRTLPLPVPVTGGAKESQLTLLDAVHGQSLAVATDTFPAPPFTLTI
jgi:hypothetical protein